jgi:cephalosporin hydroxylase
MKEFLRSLSKKILSPRSILGRMVINLFHWLWYYSPNSWMQNTFIGYPIWQCPFDLQLYQEIIVKTRPPFIIQTGVLHGGSVLYFASLLDVINAPADALVIGVDLVLTDKAKTLRHPRIRLIEGSSTDPAVVAQVRKLVSPLGGMVSLDSDHSKEHVLKELMIYRDFVAVDSYLVVEDTNANFRPIAPYHGPGPFEAVEDFLKTEKLFVRDNALWQRNLFSFHQYGWLKRVGNKTNSPG